MSDANINKNVLQTKEVCNNEAKNAIYETVLNAEIQLFEEIKATKTIYGFQNKVEEIYKSVLAPTAKTRPMAQIIYRFKKGDNIPNIELVTKTIFNSQMFVLQNNIVFNKIQDAMKNIDKLYNTINMLLNNTNK